MYKLSYESVRGLAGLYILSDRYAPQEDPESQHTLICITLSFVWDTQQPDFLERKYCAQLTPKYLTSLILINEV